MRVKATNVMAKFLSEKLKDMGYEIYFTKMSERAYRLSVDIDYFEHDEDFDYKNEKYGVIVVEYPPEYYACNEYLTTKDLVKLFRDSDKTVDGFIANVKNEIEI